MFSVNGEACLQLGNECELVCDKTGNMEFIRKKAKDDKCHAGEERYCHDKRIAQWNFRLVQRKGEGDKETQEHRKQPLDAGKQDCGYRLARLVEFFAKRQRLDGVATESSREQIVEKVAHGRVGVVRLEWNFWPLHRKPFPAVRLNCHGKRCRNKHRDNPWRHAYVPVCDDICKGNFVENVGKPTNAYEKLDNSFGKKPVARLIGCH